MQRALVRLQELEGSQFLVGKYAVAVERESERLISWKKTKSNTRSVGAKGSLLPERMGRCERNLHVASHFLLSRNLRNHQSSKNQ